MVKKVRFDIQIQTENKLIYLRAILIELYDRIMRYTHNAALK